jgi:hypothetical protein
MPVISEERDVQERAATGTLDLIVITVQILNPVIQVISAMSNLQDPGE